MLALLWQQLTQLRCAKTLQRQQITKLCFTNMNERILSIDDYDLGYTDILTHKVETGSHKPIREALRRHPQAYLQYIDNEVEKMLAAKIIEPARSEWASNVCLATKKMATCVLPSIFAGSTILQHQTHIHCRGSTIVWTRLVVAHGIPVQIFVLASGKSHKTKPMQVK